MEVTEQNIRIANEIARVLEKESCTIDQTRDILTYIIRTSGQKSTVQFGDLLESVRECKAVVNFKF